MVGGANSNDSRDSVVVFTFSAPFASFCVTLVQANKPVVGFLVLLSRCLESWPRVALLYSVSFTTLEMHVIGTERRAQVRPTCSILEQDGMSHGQSLKSSPGQADPFAQYFFKYLTSGSKI